MDLVAGSKNVVIAMNHTSKEGESKIMKKCALPLTGVGVVKKIISDLAVMEVVPGEGIRLLERAPGVSVDEIKAKTEAKLLVPANVPEMVF
jgi:3-oxoacid CoA-transferase B subunit